MFRMSDTTYDILKEIAQVWLPAIGTLYFTLSMIWGFPYAKEIVGTVTAVDTCLGTILHISTKNLEKEKITPTKE